MRYLSEIINRTKFALILLALVPIMAIAQDDHGELQQDMSALPIWVQLLHSKNTDEGKLIEEYEAFYSKHEFIKNQYTQAYKRWLRELSIRPDQLSDRALSSEESVAIRQNKRKYIKSNQTRSESASVIASWTSLGPYDWDHEAASRGYAPGAAHVYTIEQSKLDSNLLFAGTATAGIWKSLNRGLDWTSCTWNEFVSSVKAIEISPFNDSIVYAGMMDGIYWSTDQGHSWQPTGDSIFQVLNLSVTDIVAHPVKDSLLFAATNQGFFRSSNAGANWNRILTAEIQEIELMPTREDTMFLVAYVSNRTYFYKSIDAGLTWAQKGTGWPVPNFGAGDHQRRTEIAVSPSDTNLIVALATGQTNGGTGLFGIYKSTNAGETWSFTCCGPQPGGVPDSTTTPPNLNLMGWQDHGMDDGGQFYYDLALSISPTNTDSVFVGGVNQWVSANGGASFICPSKWSHPHKSEYVHADIHDIKSFGSDMWWACDGGIFFSSDRGKSIERRMTGIQGTDFWGFGVGFWDGEVMLGGTYHNGTLLKNGDVYLNGWLNTNGGDQTRGFVNIGKEKQVYNDNNVKTLPPNRLTSIPTRGMGKKPNSSYIIGQSSEIAFHPNCYSTIYIGEGTSLWKTENDGHSFNQIHDFGADVAEIEIAWSNPDIIYVATWPGFYSDKKLYRTTDAGQNWTDITPTFPTKAWIAFSIAVDARDPNILWLARVAQTTTDYDGSKVFKTIDGGSNWTNITTSSLDGENITHLVHQRNSPGGVYLGTRRAIYYKNDSMSDWSLYNSGLPLLTKTTRLSPYYRKGKIRTGTNRSVYESPFYNETRPHALFSVDKLNNGCVSDTFHFYDHSALKDSNAIWSWSFPGGSPAISTSRTPNVIYNSPGSYDVKLKVSNVNGSDSAFISSFVTIGSDCELDSIPGKTLNLNQTGSFASLIQLNDSLDRITFSAWIKPDGLQPDYSGIVFAREEGAGLNIRPNMELGYHWPGGQWFWSSNLILPQNEWSHVALVVDSNYISVFLNGFEARHSVVPQKVGFYAPIVAGIYKNWTSRNFKGEIDEVSIWNKALSADELRLKMHLTKKPTEDTALKAYYQFNETGSTIYNKVDARPALLVGSAHLIPSTAPLGGGTAAKQNIQNTGVFNFAGTGLSIGLTNLASSPNGDLVVSRINVPPDTDPSPLQTSKSYWIINNYGNNQAPVSLDSISFEEVGFSQGAAQNYVLSNRPSHAHANTWGMPIDTGSNFVATNQGSISFSTPSRLFTRGQFIISRSLGPPLSTRPIIEKKINVEEKKLRFKVFPTLAYKGDQITIISYYNERYSIELINSLGEVIIWKNNVQNLNGLKIDEEPGMYFITISAKEYVQFEKVILID